VYPYQLAVSKHHQCTLKGISAAPLIVKDCKTRICVFDYPEQLRAFISWQVEPQMSSISWSGQVVCIHASPLLSLHSTPLYVYMLQLLQQWLPWTALHCSQL
jgi:hypothetical protein